MSDPIVKGVKRSPSRPASRQNTSASSAKNRTLAAKNARPKPIVKRSPGKKAPARKAPKSNVKSASGTTKRKAVKPAPTRKAAPTKKVVAKKAKAKTTPRKPA